MKTDENIEKFCGKASTKSILFSFLFFSPFIIVSLVGSAAYTWLIFKEFKISSLILLIVLFLFASVFLFFLKRAIDNSLIIRIVPFFEKKGSVSTCFSEGRSLAKERKHLDHVAEKFNCLPLSHFVNLELKADVEPSWHSPKKLVVTVNCLLDQVNISPKSSLDSGLINELKRLKNAVDACVEKDINLCLVIRVGLDRAISPLEMDRLKGTFW